MRCVLIILSLGFYSFVFSQTLADQQKIVQKCLALKSFKSNFKPLEINGEQLLYIYDNGLISNKLNLTYSGAKVQFVKKQDLFFHSITIEECLNFIEFKATKSSASVHFEYRGRIYLVNFKHVDGSWNVQE